MDQGKRTLQALLPSFLRRCVGGDAAVHAEGGFGALSPDPSHVGVLKKQQDERDNRDDRTDDSCDTSHDVPSNDLERRQGAGCIRKRFAPDSPQERRSAEQSSRAVPLLACGNSGSGGGTRTHNLRVNSP
jgi:hypothetical protein